MRAFPSVLQARHFFIALEKAKNRTVPKGTVLSDCRQSPERSALDFSRLCPELSINKDFLGIF